MTLTMTARARLFQKWWVRLIVGHHNLEFHRWAKNKQKLHMRIWGKECSKNWQLLRNRQPSQWIARWEKTIFNSNFWLEKDLKMNHKTSIIVHTVGVILERNSKSRLAHSLRKAWEIYIIPRENLNYNLTLTNKLKAKVLIVQCNNINRRHPQNRLRNRD